MAVNAWKRLVRVPFVSTMSTIKRILSQGLEKTDTPPAAIIAPARTFVRSAMELFGQSLGGTSWN